MDEYNYLEAVKEDVLNYIKENVSFEDFEDRDELEEHLNDVLWAEDSVTGNASGSYYCNTWKAADALSHNWDVLKEALENFGDDSNPIEEGEEWCDVTIRCYLLPTAISEVLDEIDGLDNLQELYKLNEEAENLVAEYNDECIGIADWERKERWRDSYRESYRDLQKKMDLLRNTLTESLEKMQNN